MKPLLHVLGVAAGRRVRLFTEAAERVGTKVRVTDWATALDRFEAGLAPVELGGCVLHVDSTGEDQQVEARLRALGGWTTPLAWGELGGWAEQVAGLSHVLGQALGQALSTVAGDTSATDVAAAFDKPATRVRLQQAGVPVPGAGPAADEVLTTPGRWFLKPTHGSSATGVVALQVGRGRVEAWSSVEVAGDRLFNNLRVRRSSGADVHRMVELLAARGPLFVERWWPKASLSGRSVDLRVVVVGGTARTVVVRGSHGPLTNLHLGNARVELAAARQQAGAHWARFLEVAEQAAAVFPDTRCVGVDVLPRAGWKDAVVGEVNVFGDLLPGVLHEGLDSHDWQVRDLLTRVGQQFPARHRVTA